MTNQKVRLRHTFLSSLTLTVRQQNFLEETAHENTYEFGEVVATHNSQLDIFLIVSGEVRVTFSDQRDIKLGEGKFFGDLPNFQPIWKARVSEGPVTLLGWSVADWSVDEDDEISTLYRALFDQAHAPAELAPFSDAGLSYPSVFGSSEPKIFLEDAFASVGDRAYIADQNTAAACLAMLCQHYHSPFSLEDIRRYVPDRHVPDRHLPDHAGQPLKFRTIQHALNKLGFVTQRLRVTAQDLNSISLPGLVILTPPQGPPRWALFYQADQKYVTVADPLAGLLHTARGTQLVPKSALIEQWNGQIWLVEPVQKQEKFGLTWFWPAVWRYRSMFSEVLIASLSLQVLGLATPIMTQVIIDKVMVQGNLSTLDVMTVGLIGVAIFEAFLGILRLFIFSHTTRRIDLKLSSQVFRHLMALPLPYFESRKIGDTVARVQELGDIRQFLTGTALTVVLDSLFAVVYLTIMIFYSLQLTLTAFIVLPVFALLILVSTPLLRRTLDQTFNRNAERQAFLVETLGNISAVKAHTAEPALRGRWEGLTASFVRSDFRANTISNITSNLGTLLNSISYLSILWVGARLVIDQELTIGQLVAFQMLSGRAIQPILGLVRLWQDFQQVLLSVDRIGDILNSAPEASSDAGLSVSQIKGKIEFKAVTFRYAPEAAPVLNNVSFSIQPGEVVGIVGKSGSGKSTLSKLLQRLYLPDSGGIYIDSQDIQGLSLMSLRQQMGVVLQEDLLFSGTIVDNISLGRKGVTDNQILKAAQMAAVDRFIDKLPDRYETQVGERGHSLSGGERQRIALARLFLSDAPILVLDEATSALDSETENYVFNNIREMGENRTTFMITHRFSPLKQADKIIVLHQGTVGEMGTHQELIDQRGLYWALFEIQKRSL